MYADDPSTFDRTRFERFRTYAVRVRRLYFNDVLPIHGDTEACIPPSTIEMAFSNYPYHGPLLPNLKQLDLVLADYCNALAILPFIPASLRSFGIGTSFTAEQVQQFLFLLPSRAPNILYLRFQSDLPALLFGNALPDWISSCPSLQTVILSPYYHTPAVVSALQRLQCLTRLSDIVDPEVTRDESGMCLSSEDGSFPMLEELDVATSLSSLEALVKVPHRFNRLTAIHVIDQEYGGVGELFDVMNALSTGCPGIKSVALSLFTRKKALEESERIAFEAIRPLLACRELCELDIGHDLPFRLTETDVEEMAGAWRDLEVLSLCADPRPNAYVGTPLQMLRVFAKTLPGLKNLGFYCDRLGEIDAPGEDASCFKGLEVLDVGTSPFPHPDPAVVGAFLRVVCPSDFEIDSTPSDWYTGEPEAEDSQRSNQWRDAEKLAQQPLMETPPVQMKTDCKLGIDLIV